MTVFKTVSAHTLGQTAQNVVVAGTGIDNNAIMQKVLMPICNVWLHLVWMWMN